MASTPDKNGIVDVAQTGFSKAAAYDQYRPSYPPEALEHLLDNLKVVGLAQAKIVDLAAGTGKFTELIAARKEAYHITAVEPHEGMCQELIKKNLTNVTVKAGSATSIPVADQSLDAVIAAQAFHWFANEDALKEIHRVIRPGGTFGLIWNIEDYNAPRSWKPTTTWESKMKDIIWSFDDNHPRFRHEKWRVVLEEQGKGVVPGYIVASDTKPLFALPLGEDSVLWTVWLDKEVIWSRYHTLSQIAVLEGEELKKTKEQVFEALNGADVETNEQGLVALHGKTFFAWATAL